MKQKKRRDKVLEPQRWHNLIGGEVDGGLGIVGERSAAEVDLIPQIAQGGVRQGRVGTASGGVGIGVDGGGSGEAPVAAMDGEDEDASPHWEETGSFDAASQKSFKPFQIQIIIIFLNKLV